MELSTLFSLFSILISATTFLAESKAVNYSSIQNGLGATTAYTECTPSSFASGLPCTLTCNVDYTGDSNSNYVFHSSAFYYYTTDSSDMVQISNFVGLPSDKISYPLTAASYYAGYYVCKIVLGSVSGGQLNEYSHTFHVDPNKNGVKLGDNCNSKQDCFALHAECDSDSGECKCSGEHYMKYSKHSDTAACLSNVPSGAYGCLTDDQCQAGDFKSTCEGGRCVQTNHSRFSPSEVAQVTLGCFALLALLAIAAGLAMKK